jgi:hypothetical protein
MRTRPDPVLQSQSQTATADVHPHETIDATVGIALAHQNAMIRGENGAGLEIAATDETEIEIKRGAAARNATTNAEVG